MPDPKKIIDITTPLGRIIIDNPAVEKIIGVAIAGAIVVLGAAASANIFKRKKAKLNSVEPNSNNP